MPDNTGYINIVAVMQKFFDQAISGNWSYNPENYDNSEVPVQCNGTRFLNHIQVWLEDILLSEYTYDIKTDES